MLKDGTEIFNLHRAVGMVWKDGEHQPINNRRGFLFWGAKNGKWELFCFSDIVDTLKEYHPPFPGPTPWNEPYEE